MCANISPFSQLLYPVQAGSDGATEPFTAVQLSLEKKWNSQEKVFFHFQWELSACVFVCVSVSMRL